MTKTGYRVVDSLYRYGTVVYADKFLILVRFKGIREPFTKAELHSLKRAE
jgi:hypothetical protein